MFSDRSIGTLELDEFRVGTTWSDVVSLAVDRPIIEFLVLQDQTLHLGVGRLTIGATNYVEAATTLTGHPSWEALVAFQSSASTTNISLPVTAANQALFIRLRGR